MKEFKSEYHCRKTVHSVLKQTYHILLQGVLYQEATKYDGGRPQTLKIGCREENLIANYRERGLSFCKVTVIVNFYRLEMGLPFVTQSCITETHLRMAKITMNVMMRPQGSSNPKSDWEKACYHYVCQLLVRLGHDIDLRNFFIDVKLPDCFNKKKLGPLDINRIVFWDECHQDCRIGNKRNGVKKCELFP